MKDLEVTMTIALESCQPADANVTRLISIRSRVISGIKLIRIYGMARKGRRHCEDWSLDSYKSSRIIKYPCGA